MATRMQLVRHLPNDTASRKIGFTLTDEQAAEVRKNLATAAKEQPLFFQFTDAKLVQHWYQLHRILYLNFESNWIPPTTEADKKENKESE